MLRVRADLVDTLVTDAGEMSIARARIEGEMRSLKQSLLDLTENVIRLRRQLRETEIQAESQMQSRIALSQETEAAFDPLELDRFTRFQELTRMMAESVNDVATVQQNLLKNLDEANAGLIAQARLNRELQQSLMAVRMVPFASITERLYRIARQSAKELGKRANLDIQGAQIDLDQNVINKMIGPFEHLLRNSLAHGIEAPEVRRAAGKRDIGEILISIRQEGNEVIIAMRDDGGGLPFERIREKAVAKGLIGVDDAISDKDLGELIFHSGFSTAAEVTQLSGRGVGMDVVKTEVASLGGRIEVASVTGQGTTFNIYLPLTLALTNAVVVRVGASHYAIPAAMIDQVMEIKEDELAALRTAGKAVWQANEYPFHFLPQLLGETDALPESRKRYWVMLLHSGDKHVAIQIDELQKSQEIVVKNIGPQLARVVGIAGATVLGDGRVILILNPVALASRAPARGFTQIAAAPEAAPSSAITLPTVLIVDDSLTVRKITGRLLSREGYQVITAKDGVDALETLVEVVPDVILSDIEMPRMDGFELARNIRADERLRQVPVIMISSRTAEKHRQHAADLGVNDFLGKPYQEEELLGLIADYVARRH
jgi:chemosensory pili system protein ChpA (sensor histidine kinase/response regulator)